MPVTTPAGGARGRRKRGKRQPPGSLRTRIVDAAWELFWRQGFHATGVAEIAELAGVPKGSIYNYFASKDALLIAALGRLRDQNEAQLRQEVLSGTFSPAELVSRLLDHYEQLYSAYGFSRGDPLAGRLSELAGTHPELCERLLQLQTQWQAVVAQKIWAYATVTQTPGLVDAADGLAGVIYAALQGVLLMMLARRSAEPIAEARRVLMPMIDAYVGAVATGEVAPLAG